MNPRHRPVKRTRAPQPASARRKLKQPELGSLPRPDAPSVPAANQDGPIELERRLTRLRQRLEERQGVFATSPPSCPTCRELFEESPTGYIVHDSVGLFLLVNRAASIILDIQPNEVSKLSIGHFLDRDQLELWLDHMRRAATGLCATNEFSLRKRNGKPAAVQLTTVATASPEVHHPKIFRTSLIDITQRLETEAALRRTQYDYQRLIDTVEGIVWEADANTLDIVFVSRHSERLLGYPVGEWRRPGFWQNHLHVEDRERVINKVARAVARRQELKIDYRALTASRQFVWLHDSIVVVEREGKTRLLGVAVDISEHRRAQEELRRAHDLLEQRVTDRTDQLRQAVADLETFSYGLSHDLRAPIRAIRGYADLLERAQRDGHAKGSDFVHQIMASAERLDRLVQDVLQYSTIARAPVSLEAVSLDGLLENIIRDIPAIASHKSRIRIQRPLLPVYGQEVFISQVLCNLLTNALKFVPKDRTPRVRVWTEEIQTRAQSKGGVPERWARIWVEDNGIGIAPEDQTRVFRLFERVCPPEQYEGTGIGLTIVQKAIERMGGRMGLESACGEGSKFWIELRCAE
jgi:PAS domain S-box-containing protein